MAQCSAIDCIKQGTNHCGKCKNRLYCSRECQKKHWPIHKTQCGVKFPTIEIVDIPGKGKGVITKEHIARGTLIISEKPRIIVPDVLSPGGVKEALSQFSEEDLIFFLSFPATESWNIMDRFKHFTPCVGDDKRGLCETICRVNHTCFSPKGAPNASYFWNVNSKEEELRAIQDIREGQEIEVSYMSNASDYRDPLSHLRDNYTFDCSCPGCSRPASERRASAQKMFAYNKWVDDLPRRFGPDNPLSILNDIEEHIVSVCKEGWFGDVGRRAHDAFQLCAYYGDAESAQKWEAICRDSHALFHGEGSEEYKKSAALAADGRKFRAWSQLGRKKLRGPSQQVLNCFYPDV
ncbi:SET domain-containing protein [Favolaschia claudopus]|uniref:SET domain-containing protein n=1 Tax=Favolaschia claudopus TaxID=2862362 RepID=A0AAW0DQX0_9AGAR